ncbi:MAG: two-component system nitrogen regulation sensor histidine kinase NtrY, partial [Cyclobacteriaceae bacterium]
KDCRKESKKCFSLNKTNKKVAYFFDAVCNDNSTLHFPEVAGNRTERFINKSLNKVNRLIETVK